MADPPTDHPTAPDRPMPTNGTAGSPTTPHTAGDRSADHADPRWLKVALPVAVWTLTAVVTFLALSGQVEFAEWAGITDWRRYLVPAGLELVAVGFLLLGYRRARHGYSPAAMWLLAAAVGGFAVWTNVVHAGERAGPLFGAFTATAVILWFVKFRDDYGEHRRRTGQATKPQPKFGKLWLVAPRVTARAGIIATRLQITEVNLAMVYAELWLAVHADAKTAGVATRLRRRTAWRTVMRAADHPVADLPTTAEVATVAVVDRPAPTPAAPEPTADTDQPEPEPTTPTRPKATRKPTKKRPLRLVVSPTVAANARALRERYGDQLPTDRRVRDEMGWSYDRAKPAIDAHRTGADREATDQSTDRGEPDDDKEREPWAA